MSQIAVIQGAIYKFKSERAEFNGMKKIITELSHLILKS